MKRSNFVTVPNGATHFSNDDGQPVPAFYRVKGKRWEVWSEARRVWSGFDPAFGTHAIRGIAELRSALQGIASEAWNVAALPPVGLTCEVENPHEDGHWCQCTIIAWEAECAVFRAAGDYPYVYDGRGVGCFRPSRTQEVVNHARHEAVMELGALLIDSRGDSMEYHQAGLIYDAGWRKPEAAQ